MGWMDIDRQILADRIRATTPKLPDKRSNDGTWGIVIIAAVAVIAWMVLR